VTPIIGLERNISKTAGDDNYLATIANFTG